MKPRALAVGGAWVLTLAVAGATGWYAAKVATTPPAASQPEPLPVTVGVEEMTLEVTEPYPVAADWPLQPTTPNGRSGVLTSISPLTDAVSEGDVLYTVDLMPVVAAKGDIVSFRDLTEGDVGPDVEQLEEFLVRAGFMEGTPDEKFSPATTNAVKAWGKFLGYSFDGTVPRGAVMFLPELPTHLVASTETRAGMSVAPGDAVVQGAASSPSFWVTVLPDALDRFQPGQRLTLGDSGAVAVVDHLTEAPDGTGMRAVLGPADGQESICDEDCSALATMGESSFLTGNLEVVPSTTGPSVPTTALWNDAAGATCVEVDGSARRVEVLASSGGRSVVDGVSVGETVNAVPSRDASC